MLVRGQAPALANRVGAVPVSELSEDDEDAGWGELPEPDDDERFERERPPHWDSAWATSHT
jgi:hypothetical protein